MLERIAMKLATKIGLNLEDLLKVIYKKANSLIIQIAISFLYIICVNETIFFLKTVL